MLEKSIQCERCKKKKGDLVKCIGTCGTFYHRLCLQIDCVDAVDWNAKKEPTTVSKKKMNFEVCGVDEILEI